MPAAPMTHAADQPSEGLRLAAASVALAAGLPATLALVSGFADPATGTTDFLIAAGFIAAGIIAGLGLRLYALHRERHRLAERLEALQDLSWEMSDAGSRQATDAVIPIATVSHEMRAPLHGMLALSDLLAATPLSPEQHAYLAALNQSAGALARLVDDLLDASRIATGQFSLAPAPVEIEPFVEGIAELLAPLAHERGIGIASRVAPGLPPVMVDGGRLRQVLINLATNAIEATTRGGVVITVDAADQPQETGIGLTFAVHDSGPGIAGGDNERIFASFERAHDGGAGLGLGLSISQQIMLRMGSEIRHEPRSDGGTVFHFTLGLPTIGQGGRVARPLDGLPLLLVMPAGLEADALIAALDAAGAETRRAASLPEAAGLVGAATAAGQPYRMVLADARTALDARAALERLREASGAPIAVAIMIDSSERRAADRLKADGFDAYLIRPVRRRSLLQVVGESSRWPHRFVADPADEEERLPPVRREGRPLDVLVVEDDPVSGLLARAVLERLGHDVTEMRTLTAARARLATPPDAALIDLSLPDGEGLSLLGDFARLAEHGTRPALIATSGRGGAEIRAAALSAGADLFLEKPVSAERLCRAFEEALARRAGGGSARHQTA